MTEPMPLEVDVPEGPPVSQDPTWVPEDWGPDDIRS